MMPRLCSAADGEMLNSKLQGSGSGCSQFATRLIASLKASVGGLGLWYVVFGGFVSFVRVNLLICLFSSSLILHLSSRRCWVTVVFLGWSVGRSLDGAVGNWTFTWDGSIGAGFCGVSIVSSTVKSDGLFGGGIIGGAVGRSFFWRWSMV